MMRSLLGAVPAVFAVTTAIARADGVTENTPFAVNPERPWTIDGGLVVAAPSVLPGTMSTGIAAGIMRRCGCHLEYGARVSWSTASGSSVAWSVSHDELRLRVSGGARHAVGRGIFGLRAGLGTNVIHEARDRNQGERAGLTGNDLRTEAWRALPALDVEGVVALRVAGSWLVVVSGGPSFKVFDRDINSGFTGQLGIAWQP